MPSIGEVTWQKSKFSLYCSMLAIRGIDLGLGLFLGGQILVEVLLADGPGRFGDDQCTLIVGLGQFQLRPGQLELAGRLIVLGLIGSRIDLEQQIALLDVRAFLERHLDQIAGHPRADVDRVDRVGPAGVVDVVGDLALNGLADCHDLRSIRRWGGAAYCSRRRPRPRDRRWSSRRQCSS